MLAKISGLNPKGPYLSLEKEKEHFWVVFTYSIKQAREIRKFHVAVVAKFCLWNRNPTKDWNPDSIVPPKKIGIRNLESRIRNPESKAVLDFRQYMGR